MYTGGYGLQSFLLVITDKIQDTICFDSYIYIKIIYHI